MEITWKVFQSSLRDKLIRRVRMDKWACHRLNFNYLITLSDWAMKIFSPSGGFARACSVGLFGWWRRWRWDRFEALRVINLVIDVVLRRIVSGFLLVKIIQNVAVGSFVLLTWRLKQLKNNFFSLKASSKLVKKSFTKWIVKKVFLIQNFLLASVSSNHYQASLYVAITSIEWIL